MGGRFQNRRTLLAAMLWLLIGVTSTAAQGTPPERQARSVDTVAPPPAAAADDGFLEKARSWAKENQIVGRLSGDTDGWYPRIGGMTRGGGFALGPGYRTHVFADHVLLDLSAGISTKAYKAADAKARWLQAFDERVELWTDFRYEDFPQEDFFGRGFESRESDRTSYDLANTAVTLRGIYRPVRSIKLGVTLGYARPRIDTGTDENFPSVEQRFTDADAPGLLDRPTFSHRTVFAEADFRDVPGNPHDGGFYRASFGAWDDRTYDRYDFFRFDATGTQFVPLVASKRHVVMGRLGASYVNNATGHRVPFYYMAYVGGVDTIRSFREFRFKDENALWLNAEYRWTPMRYFTVLTFYDAGEVRADWEDIGFRGLKHGYGFGVRAHSSKQTFASIDVGTGGGEGWRVFLKFGPSL